MWNMTIEEMYRDKNNMGISVVSYTLKAVRDEVGYLASLGQARTS